jgi:PAT family beta-lactamase induction signal transducer AmpG
MEKQRKPSIYINSLYFAEGLPYTIVNMMSQVLFKSLGADNVFIGHTSLLSIPWILKFAWSPLVDLYATKRSWVVAAEFILAVLVLGIAGVTYMGRHLPLNAILLPLVIVFTLTALASSTHDVSIDGYYLDVLNEEQKAFFVGVRNTAYRVSMIFGSGAMVYLAGTLATQMGLQVGWAIAFAVCALAMALCAIFHKWYLPKLQRSKEAPQFHGDAMERTREFAGAIATYFQQPGIAGIVFYILVFRLGDAFMLKQASNFLLDPPGKAGLGLSVADMGIVTGTVGVIVLLLGGITASWLISKGGLRRWMWPLALFQNAAILLYWALSTWPRVFAVPGTLYDNPYLPAVYVINSIEQFAYGCGTTAYTVFLLTTVKSEYKAAHYATATALMALGLMLPQYLSGDIYKVLGYSHFFLMSFFASLPGILAIFFLPIWRTNADVVTTGGEVRGIQKAGQVGSESK